MRWEGDRESDNVEDRRGISGGQIAAGGGIGAIIIGLIYVLLGGNPSDVLQQTQSFQQQQGTTIQRSPEEEKLASFSKVVLGYTEDVWDSLYRASGNTYRKPRLVLFTESTQSGCGFASAITGPFYCPPDEKLYLDLSFFNELQQRFKVEGEFAMAYVIAHEVGHHIQKLMGTSDKMEQLRARLSETEYNKMSVKLELQADFLAGMWAHYTQQMKKNLDYSDIESALNAANAIGDDRLQQQAQGRVVPDAFTHGTSKQRMYWFKKGYDTGDLRQGDTFNTPDL
jgi:hypothetical protein